jgi:hypothetical protein
MIDIRDGRRATQMDLDTISGPRSSRAQHKRGQKRRCSLRAERSRPPDWFSVRWSAILCLSAPAPVFLPDFYLTYSWREQSGASRCKKLEPAN